AFGGDRTGRVQEAGGLRRLQRIGRDAATSQARIERFPARTSCAPHQGIEGRCGGDLVEGALRLLCRRQWSRKPVFGGVFSTMIDVLGAPDSIMVWNGILNKAAQETENVGTKKQTPYFRLTDH